ncbi:hypothetical protein B5S30_g5339 [[Candida] boidinii]|nr:hypothetical protein B5S30_g5339 [[Candida] boidinii]GMF99034.1 unnamed protein product [[Candida] boidinii]
MRTRRSRIRILVYLVTAIGLIYLASTVISFALNGKTAEQKQQEQQQLEQQKQEQQGNTQDKESEEIIYDFGTEPLRADFNPDQNELSIPKIVDLDKVNEALNNLQLRPLDNSNKKNNNDNDLENQENYIPQPSDDYTTKKIDKISKFVTDRDFKEYPLKSYVGNKIFKINNDLGVSTYEDLKCKELVYDSNDNKDANILISDPIPITDSLKDIVSSLKGTEYERLIKMNKKPHSKINDSWFTFAGSSIWLEDESCHLMVSRVIYAPEYKDKPIISFMRLQLFDSDWKEIKDKRIRYNDLTKDEIDAVLRNYNYNDKDKNKILDPISLKFPTLLHVPFDSKVTNKRFLGPEDPRIILKDGEYSKEPVIIFNMRTTNNVDERGMHAIFPFRKPNPKSRQRNLIKFKIQGLKVATELSIEKSWTPFFDTFKVGDSANSDGIIFFIYTFDPLVILKCSLDNGRCQKLQDNIYGSTFSKESKGYIHGGSEMQPIPRNVIKLLNNGDENKLLQMWITFPRTNIKRCGCGKAFYRPSLAVIIKEDGIFRSELMSDSIDFGLNVLSWNGKDSTCDDTGPNVLIPNGISFWDIKLPDISSTNNKDRLPVFNDILGLTISESDSNTKLIFIKNILNYIMNVYNDKSNYKYMLGGYNYDGDVTYRTNKVSTCMIESAIKACRVYGRDHGVNEPAGIDSDPEGLTK